MEPDRLAALTVLLDDRSRRQPAARALVEALRSEGPSPTLARALEVLALDANLETEPERLVELGRVRFALDGDEEAFLAFARALYLAPEAPAVFAALEGLPNGQRAQDLVRELLVDAPEASRPRLERLLRA